MHIIAGASPDNTPAGYYWTFLFPELLFIVIALILWALFGRPHHRVPTGRITLGMSSSGAGVTTAAATAAGPGVASGGDGQLEAGGEPSAGVGESAGASESAVGDESAGGQPLADGAGAGA